MISLDDLADHQEFQTARQAQRGEMIAWKLCSEAEGSQGVFAAEVADAFVTVGLPRPKSSRILEYFRKSRNMRSLGRDRYAPTRDFAKSMEKMFTNDEASIVNADELLPGELKPPPYVHTNRLDDLQKMVSAYAKLFLLENSMRGLIEEILSKELGTSWWEKAANGGMKKKHADRVANEEKKKWAPTRSEYGPLYSIDWPDLITIMRKYPEYFQPILKDINFLHRYEDAGAYRNVVAHNGVLREKEDFDLIDIYYSHWIKQIS